VFNQMFACLSLDIFYNFVVTLWPVLACEVLTLPLDFRRIVLQWTFLSIRRLTVYRNNVRAVISGSLNILLIRAIVNSDC